MDVTIGEQPSSLSILNTLNSTFHAHTMLTVSPVGEQRIVLRNIRWDTYMDLVKANQDNSAPRMTYANGVLEFVAPSADHEETAASIDALVQVVAEGWEIAYRNLRSTTFQRDDLERGFEPDSSYYIQSLDQIRGQRSIDLHTDPAPDLVVEVDITSPSIDKLPIFARLNIPEVWRYADETLVILELDNGGYSERTHSIAFPLLSAAELNRFIRDYRTQRRPEWLRNLRQWAQSLMPSP